MAAEDVYSVTRSIVRCSGSSSVQLENKNTNARKHRTKQMAG